LDVFSSPSIGAAIAGKNWWPMLEAIGFDNIVALGNHLAVHNSFHLRFLLISLAQDRARVLAWNLAGQTTKFPIPVRLRTSLPVVSVSPQPHPATKAFSFPAKA
jgi:hypothetical protein